MLFLPPNQQHQSTEGRLQLINKAKVDNENEPILTPQQCYLTTGEQSQDLIQSVDERGKPWSVVRPC